MTSEIHNLRVAGFYALPAPAKLLEELPSSERATATVLEGRQAIRDALAGKDQRMLVIAGPCSIHDREAAVEYAERLSRVSAEISDRILLVMRVYFEKPRTTVGWKGLISDPHLDGSNDMEGGVELARKILLEINELGMPCATEFLDPIVPQYTADLVVWTAIGARTTESQTHRQMASGLSMPVGFKNATDGSLQIALDAITSAGHPHAFLGIDMEGRTCIVRAMGNPNAHLVLRGGGGDTNFSRAHIAYAKVMLDEVGHPRPILVDCSHGNSEKDFTRQPDVFRAVLEQMVAGEEAILGVMLESHLVEGKQGLSESLVHGQSLTDACIGWDATETLLREAHARLGRDR
jgi:3-deoxy-7-phosphoheptulonate synthase